MGTAGTHAFGHAVEDSKFLPIGGLEQWVAVAGHDDAAPIVLFLHGGPGEAMSPFMDIFAPYETDFTMAIWDQRGAGKTYGRSGAKSDGMEADRFIADTIELAEYLRRHYAKKRIVLFGHSWGAALGLQTVKRRPDLFHAYLGCGLPVSLERTILSQERYARRELSAKKDEAALHALDDASKLPFTDPKRRFAVRSVLMGEDDRSFLKRESDFTGPKPWPTKGEVADWIAGYTFTSEVLVPRILTRDVLDQVGLDVPVPFIVVQGADDHITPTDVARGYFDEVKAPSKNFVEVKGGHFACYTNPAAVLDAMRRHILPLCRS